MRRSIIPGDAHEVLAPAALRHRLLSRWSNSIPIARDSEEETPRYSGGSRGPVIFSVKYYSHPVINMSFCYIKMHLTVLNRLEHFGSFPHNKYSQHAILAVT